MVLTDFEREVLAEVSKERCWGHIEVEIKGDRLVVSKIQEEK